MTQNIKQFEDYLNQIESNRKENDRRLEERVRSVERNTKLYRDDCKPENDTQNNTLVKQQEEIDTLKLSLAQTKQVVLEIQKDIKHLTISSEQREILR